MSLQKELEPILAHLLSTSLFVASDYFFWWQVKLYHMEEILSGIVERFLELVMVIVVIGFAVSCLVHLALAHAESILHSTYVVIDKWRRGPSGEPNE